MRDMRVLQIGSVPENKEIVNKIDCGICVVWGCWGFCGGGVCAMRGMRLERIPQNKANCK